MSLSIAPKTGHGTFFPAQTAGDGIGPAMAHGVAGCRDGAIS